MKNIKLELLKAANRHYPDGYLANYFDEETGDFDRWSSGDGLALFIVLELSEAAEGDPVEAIRLMERAKNNLDEVIQGLQGLSD